MIIVPFNNKQGYLAQDLSLSRLLWCTCLNATSQLTFSVMQCHNAVSLVQSTVPFFLDAIACECWCKTGKRKTKVRAIDQELSKHTPPMESSDGTSVWFSITFDSTSKSSSHFWHDFLGNAVDLIHDAFPGWESNQSTGSKKISFNSNAHQLLAHDPLTCT